MPVQRQPRPAWIALGLLLPPLVLLGPWPVRAGGGADGDLALENRVCGVSVSRATGAIAGMWDVASGTTVLADCGGHYRLETAAGVRALEEKTDAVVSYRRETADGLPALVLDCRNGAFDALRIRKRYVLGPGRRLAKRVSFSTSDAAGFFIRYTCETVLDPAYGNRIQYAVAAPEYGHRTLPVYRVPVTDQPGGRGVVTARDFSLGMAGFCYRVNDRFVMRRGSINRMGPRIVETTTGWRETVFEDYLRAPESVSAEVCWVLFSGDFTVFERWYQRLPEYRDLYDTDHPGWTTRVGYDLKSVTSAPEQQQLVDEASPLLTTAVLWSLSPLWGDWGAHGVPESMHPDVFGIAPGLKARHPVMRVSAYTRGENFDRDSVIHRNHPGFGVHGKEGELLVSPTLSDSTRQPTFYRQLLAPGCRAFYIDQYIDRQRGWGLDFIYIDSPGCNGLQDWRLRDVCQWYDWMDYLRELRRGVQGDNPDAAVFVNEWNVPYSDFGYIEWQKDDWMELGGRHWQSRAVQLMMAKLNEPEGMVTIPMGVRPANDGVYSSYVTAFGWCPQRKGARASDVNKIPFSIASWELRGSELVEDAAGPRWWREGGDLEVYALRKGGTALIGLIPHFEEEAVARITAHPEKLGLETGKAYHAYLLKMKDPEQIAEGRAFEEPKFLGRGTCPRRLEYAVSAGPAVLLQLVVLTQVPAILETVDGRPTQTAIADHPHVTIAGQDDGDGIALEVDCRADACTLLVPGRSTRDPCTGASGAVDATWAGGDALRVKLGRGRHSIRIHKATAGT